LIVSSTVTTAVAAAVLPAASVAVSTTLFAPKLLQLNEALLKLNTGVEQLSEVPLFTAATVKLAVPAALRYKVAGFEETAGACRSTTFTTTERVRLFPWMSTAVTETALAPKSAQLKAVLLKFKVAIPQLSVTVGIWAKVKVACPWAFSGKVTGKLAMTGFAVSKTVIVNERLTDSPA
jgi:hypothetical protein